MSETADPTFRTKSGTCTVTPDRLILARAGARGSAAEFAVGGSIGRILRIYGALGIAAMALGIWSIVGGDAVAGVSFILLGAVPLWIVVANRRNSGTPIVERNTIRSVEAYPPRPPAVRGHFRVWFEEGGRM